MRETIDGAAFKAMIISAAASIKQHKQQINELNVFPVPDGDTGMNMSMTMDMAASELSKVHDGVLTLTKAADITAGALLRGARGNSGVILSLLFRGFAKSVKDKETIDGFDFANALSEGVDAAYKAVMKPAEGTILTVSRVSSNYAISVALEDPCAETVLSKTIVSAKDALEDTVNQNPVLQKAGVVDSGGKGYVVILDGMLSALQGTPIEYDDSDEPAGASHEAATFSDFATEDITFGYCTEFIVSRENTKDPELLRAFLSSLGDSLVLVDDDEIIKVHVHTNDPGVAITEALTYGSLVTVKVENMRNQHTEAILHENEASARKIAAPEKRYGFVAVCAGDGLASVFRDLGVDGIIQGGQTMNPSTEDILREIDKTPAEVVFVMPNNKNIIMAAQQCVPLSEKRVIVLPTKTVPQGITAMLTVDMSMEPEDIVAAVGEAVGSVKTMQITYAARDSDYDGYSISAGDYLGLYESSLLGTDTDINVLLGKFAQRAGEEGCSFITLYYGQGVSKDDAENAGRVFAESCPSAEVQVLYGGQPVYYYMISAE